MLKTDLASNKAVLVLPRLRVQNANAISSPMTWGFPAISAFTGLMTALERKLGSDAGVAFYGVGVVCHSFEPQASRVGYNHRFHLTRNPVLQNGKTAPIVEEGKVHLEITLIFEVGLNLALLGETERTQLAMNIFDLLAGMRIAGGTLVPQLAGNIRKSLNPQLELISDDTEARRKDFRRLSRRWLPGFALVSRDDLLHKRLTDLRIATPGATLLDAWLDLLRINYRAVIHESVDNNLGQTQEFVEWVSDKGPGWIVPIPVGFSAISHLYEPGTVRSSRDPNVHFRFVESVYSMGQWVSPHRLKDLRDLLWWPSYDPEIGLYRCTNDFDPSPASPVYQD